MNKVRLYLPIENLDVDKEFNIGRITFYPSSASDQIMTDLIALGSSNRHPEAQELLTTSVVRDFSEYMQGRAVASLELEGVDEYHLIPQDRRPFYTTLRQALAVLYMLQRDIAGRLSMERQKFSLLADMQRSISFIVAFQGHDRAVRSSTREGILADWRFTEKEIKRFKRSDVYLFFHHTLRKKRRTDMEQRLTSAIEWLYDAALDYSHHSRMVKITTALEALFVGKDEKPTFTLALYSALLGCPCVPRSEGYCPIPDSTSLRKYSQLSRNHKLRGNCSTFWDMVDWYNIRGKIVHGGEMKAGTDSIHHYELQAHNMVASLSP